MNKIMQEHSKKTVQDLQKEIVNTRKEIEQMSAEWVAKPPKDTNAIVKKKKKLAVLFTILNSKIKE